MQNRRSYRWGVSAYRWYVGTVPRTRFENPTRVGIPPGVENTITSNTDGHMSPCGVM
jgi:hypothetical protein